MLESLTENPQTVIAICAALSVFSAILVVSWPYLVRDPLSMRMRQIASERERIRARERARLEAQKKQASLRAEPKRFFKEVVDRFNLAKQGRTGAPSSSCAWPDIAAKTRFSCSWRCGSSCRW